MNILEQRAIRSKRVSYELVPLYRGDGYSEAVYARIGRACVETGAIIETCFAGALYVRVAPSLVGRFAELVKCGADFLPRTQADGTTQRACPGACAKTLMVRRTAKLVPEQVVEIRRLHRGGASARSLAVRFGAGYTTIKKLLNGETWKTVPDAPTPSTAPGERGAEVRA